MNKTISSIIIALFLFCLTACQGASSSSIFVRTSTPTPTSKPTIAASPTSTITPTSTLTPSPTSTQIVVSRVIPKDFYSIVKIEYSMFKDGKAESICIFTSIHKVLKVESAEVVEITPQLESQKVLGNCPSILYLRRFKLNVFTGEVLADSQNPIGKDTYYGKNYRGDKDDVFSLSGTPVPVWKIIEPSSEKNSMGFDDYVGTTELLIDKATGIVIYRKIELQSTQGSSFTILSTQGPSVTILLETVYMRTNAPIGGLLGTTEFTYTKEQ